MTNLHYAVLNGCEALLKVVKGMLVDCSAAITFDVVHE